MPCVARIFVCDKSCLPATGLRKYATNNTQCSFVWVCQLWGKNFTYMVRHSTSWIWTFFPWFGDHNFLLFTLTTNSSFPLFLSVFSLSLSCMCCCLSIFLRAVNASLCVFHRHKSFVIYVYVYLYTMCMCAHYIVNWWLKWHLLSDSFECLVALHHITYRIVYLDIQVTIYNVWQ